MTGTQFDLHEIILLEMGLPTVGNWGLKHSEFEPAANAFSANRDRIHSLLLLTPGMIDIAYLHAQIHTISAHRAYGDYNPTKAQQQADPTKLKEYDRLFCELFNNYNDRSRRDGEAVVDEMRTAVSMFGDYINAYHCSPSVAHGVEALISSSIVLACTAIDVLLADLCLVAADPVQKEKRKGKFGSLKTTRESYGIVFGESSKPRTTLDSADLDGIAQARHLLVHRAGVADDIYVKKQPACPRLPALTKGQPFPLRGSIAAPLIVAAIAKGEEIVRAVDDWKP